MSDVPPKLQDALSLTPTGSVILDQYSLSGAGADRGLGRYARTLSDALQEAGRAKVIPLYGSTYRSGLEPLAIQRGIARLQEPLGVPYHATSVDHLPLRKTRPWICSVQDVIPLDLPDYRRLGIKSRLFFANSLRADVIVANSAHTAARITARTGIDRAKIQICPLPVSESYLDAFAKNKTPTRKPGSGPYVVALADLRSPDPRKRFHWIGQMARGLAVSGIQMIVTGRGLTAENFPDAEVVPPMDDAGLAHLYANALATFYPTAYEGQGLPPLEAMATGCPVIAFRNSSVSEMVQLDEFLFDDPLPWEEQDLSAPMPTESVGPIVERLQSWLSDSSRLHELRASAHAVAGELTLRSLGNQLANIYSLASK